MSRALILLITLAGAVATVSASWILLRRPPSPGALAQTRLGDISLVYAPAYARFAGGRAGGRLDRLDLAATLPDFKPAGAVARPLGGDEASGLLFLSIGPQDSSVDPAERTATLYDNFLEADVEEEPSGLIMRRFAQGSPYAGEDLYFDPPEGRNFAARCARPAKPPDALPLTCIAAIRIDGLDIDARFDRAALPLWATIAQGTRNFVREIKAR